MVNKEDITMERLLDVIKTMAQCRTDIGGDINMCVCLESGTNKVHFVNSEVVDLLDCKVLLSFQDALDIENKIRKEFTERKDVDEYSNKAVELLFAGKDVSELGEVPTMDEDWHDKRYVELLEELVKNRMN